MNMDKEYVELIKANFTNEEVEEATWRQFYLYQEDKSVQLLQQGIDTLIELDVSLDIVARALDRVVKALEQRREGTK